MTVLTVVALHESEKIIEKSRFLAYSAHAEGEEAARAFLAEIRKRHSLATHCCYAFIADKEGNLQRFSDDGEPQGTAGMPILEVLKNKGLVETAVAVVRYFGGIKLGAGGLVRAYSSAASENLAGAEIRKKEMCVRAEVVVAYTKIDILQRFFTVHACPVLHASYEEEAAFTVEVRKSEKEKFFRELSEALQGRVKIFEKGEYYAFF